MVTGSQIVLALSILLSVQFVFASNSKECDHDYELIESNIFDPPYSSPLEQCLADKVVYNGATWLVQLQKLSLRNPHLPKQLLDIFSTVDRLFQPDWSLMNVSVYQIVFVYEKLKDFVRAHGRFPVSLQSFLRPYGHVLRGLESKLGMAANQRLGAFLIRDLRATLQAIHSGDAVPDWLLPTAVNSSLASNDLEERAIFAVEAVFRVSLGLDVILAVSETHMGEADKTLTSQIIAGLYKLNGIYGFLPFSNQRISTEERRKVYGLLKSHLPVEIFARGSMHGLALALMYGSIEDIGAFKLTLFPKVFSLWSTASCQPKSWQVFVSQLWAREDAAQVLQLLVPRLSDQMLQQPKPPQSSQHLLLAAFTCDPTTDCYLKFAFHWLWYDDLFLFPEFLRKCVNLDETPSRAAFETELFKRFLQSPCPECIDACNSSGHVRAAAINLAVARARRDDAEALLKVGFERMFLLDPAVYAAVKHSEYVYEGPMVEMYVAKQPVVYGAIWGRIVTSAVVRNDAKLLELLRKKLALEDDSRLRPFVDFPFTPLYVDIYCSLFDGKTPGSHPGDHRREALAGLQELAKSAAPHDAWATDASFSDWDHNFLATLGSQLDGFDPDAFLQQPSFQPQNDGL